MERAFIEYLEFYDRNFSWKQMYKNGYFIPEKVSR